MSRDTKWNRRNNNNSRNHTPTRERDRGGDDDLPPSLPGTPTTTPLNSSTINYNEWENIKLGPDIDQLQDSIVGGCTIIPYNISIEEWTSGAVILPQVNFKITQQLPGDIYERAKLLTQLCKTPVLKSVFSGGDFNNIFMAELDEKYICLTAITTGYRMQANQLLNLITQYGKTPYGNGIIFRFERSGNGNYKYHPVGKKELVLLLNKLLYQKMIEAVRKDKLIRQHYWESDPECTEGIKLFGNDVEVENVEKWALDTKLMAFQYKIHKCNRVKIHQKQTCPFFHSLADARRSPELFQYSEKRCTQGFEECFNGIHCTLSHNEFEHFYHPSFLRHSDCMHWKQTGKCKGPLCSFYHPEEMTPPIGKENPQLPYPLPPSISNPPTSIGRHATSNPSLSTSSSSLSNQRIFSPDPRRLNSPDLRRNAQNDNYYNSPSTESNSTPNLYLASPLTSSSNQIYHANNQQNPNDFRLRSSGNAIENYPSQPSNMDFRSSGNEINNHFYPNPNENYGNSLNYGGGMGISGGNTPTGSPMLSSRMIGSIGSSIHDSPRSQPQSSLHKSSSTIENNNGNLPFNPSNLRNSTASLQLNQPIPSNTNNPPPNRLKSSTGSTIDLLRTSGNGNIPTSTPTSSVRTSSTIDLLRNSNNAMEFNNTHSGPQDASGYHYDHYIDYRLSNVNNNQTSPMSPMVPSNFNRLHPNSNNSGSQASPLSELTFASSNPPPGSISLTNSMNQQSMYPQSANNPAFYGLNAPLSGDLMYIYPSDQLKDNQNDYFNIFHNNFSELIVNQEINFSNNHPGVNYSTIHELNDVNQQIQMENESISLMNSQEFKFNNLFLQQSENICLEILSSYVSLILINIFGEQWKNQLNLLLIQLLSSSKPSQSQPVSQTDRIVFSWNFENLQKIILNIQDNHKNLLFKFPNCKSNDFYEFFKRNEMKDSHYSMEQFKLEIHLIEIIRYESIHFNYLEIEILISKFYEFLNKNYQNSPITMESILYGSHFWNLFKLNQFQRRNFNVSNHTTPIHSPSTHLHSPNLTSIPNSPSNSLLSSNSSLKHILIILGNLPISNYLQKLNESIFLCHLPWNFVFDFNENENSIFKQTMNSYLLNNYSKSIQVLNQRGEFVNSTSLHDLSNEHINKNLHSNSSSSKLKLNENQLYWMKMIEKYKNEDEEKYSKSIIGGYQDLFLFHLLEQLKSEFVDLLSFPQDNKPSPPNGNNGSPRVPSSFTGAGKGRRNETNGKNKKLSIECTVLMYDEEYIFNHSINKHLNHFINFLYRYPEIDCQFSIFTDCKENNIYSYFSEEQIQRSVHFISFHQLSWGFQQLVDIESIQIVLPSSSPSLALPPAADDDDLPPSISLPTR